MRGSFPAAAGFERRLYDPPYLECPEENGMTENVSQLIDAAWQARREDRHEAAERDLLRPITLARRGNLRVDLIRGLNALAHVVRDVGQNERALPLSEEAVALSREQADPLLLAHSVRHLGDLHRAVGRLSEADRCYSEAMSLYRAAPTPLPSI